MDPFIGLYRSKGTEAGVQGMDGWMDGWIDGRMDVWMDGWMDVWMDGWMDGCLDGWMDGWMDGWLDGWMDVLFCLAFARFVLVSSRVYPSAGGNLSASFVPYLVLCCRHIKCLGCLAK